MTKGQKVLVSLQMLPGHKFEGTIVAKARGGFRVRYDSFGAFFTANFMAHRVEAI